MNLDISETSKPAIRKRQPINQWSIGARLKSFSYAFEGIRQFLVSEAHARIHLVATLIVIFAGIYFRVNAIEVIALTISVSLVWIAEMLNTAIEKSMDLVTRKIHPQVKLVKDVAAGAVLLAASSAIIVGAVIFIPKIFML